MIMKKQFRWIYVYVGYYEVVITDQHLDKPLMLVSKHKSVENAEQFIEKEYPSASVLYDENIQDLTEWYWMDEEDDDYGCIFFPFADKAIAWEGRFWPSANLKLELWQREI